MEEGRKRKKRLTYQEARLLIYTCAPEPHSGNPDPDASMNALTHHICPKVSRNSLQLYS